MIKGWRNDPAWVAHYAKRDAEHEQRVMNRVQLEILTRQNESEIEDSMRRLRLWAEKAIA